MSTIQDNPFKQSDDQVYGEETPPKSSKKGCLIGCAIAGALGLLICCGGAAYFYTQAASMINVAMAGALQGQLTSEPNVQSQIGEIESLEFDMSNTFENAQKASESGGEPRLAFRIKGSKGSGTVLIENDDSGPSGIGIKSGTLVMDDGSEFPLDVEAMRAAAPEEIEIDMDDLIDDGESLGIEVEPGPLSPDAGGQNDNGVDNNDT